ncbi:tRNA (adenine(37)-N6)-methyltransferase [Xyrichtys novacula]|uniref:tRNA (adenine(37)-N6)-methyltransferase n=1 Tax=Xyrichtys novacula TaxID=13765 RepID=A0AAV1EUI5_XYRNO|nr:tRNA (adenine(37)-N6)-methyltransferase [Xyrichtys novacula]
MMVSRELPTTGSSKAHTCHIGVRVVEIKERASSGFICSCRSLLLYYFSCYFAKMTPVCDSCCENIMKLNQQVSVMRKEIKNLRQMLESANRANRKHMTSIQSVVSKIELSGPNKEKVPSPQPLPQPPPPSTSPEAALEQGNIQTVPIGHISSCFSLKNGTPRQPTICGPSRAELQIQQKVFNNPEHSLVGLEQYSHVWIIFLFHKNGHLSYKAKVKPPRLNGQRVGVFSTRSPHRPNAIGLTLAKLDKIVGDTLHLSDIDMIAGTPVLDIKPYIPDYDSPQTRMVMDSETHDLITEQLYPSAESLNETTDALNLRNSSETNPLSGPESERADDDNEDHNNDSDGDDREILLLKKKPNCCSPDTESADVGAQFFLSKDLHRVVEEVKTFVSQGKIGPQSCVRENQVLETKTKPPGSTLDQPCYGVEAYSTIASWIREPPVGSLDVRFTPNAERELAEFLPAHLSAPSDRGQPQFRFLRSSEEAAAAIRGVLSADPRSVYRRSRCTDKLFFFTLDTADITCWFGQGFAEVLQVRPVEQPSTSV